jgi:Cu+-exporting ATPase
MENQKCIHCGEDCGKYPVIHNDNAFCCHGCKAVFQILHEKDLTQYYSIAENPGIKVDDNQFGKKYAYLDNEEIVSKLLSFSEDGISQVTLYIPAIHCSSCIWLLENLNTLNPSIIQSTVHFVKKEVTILFKDENISLRQIVEMLASIHYIPKITLENIEEEKNKKSNKALIYKIGIAGFCFGNTMLLSVPEYLPGKELIGENFRSFFGLLNFILALPVFFYSSSDYLLSAYKNLRHKIINIDLPISLGIITIFVESSYEIFSKSGTGYMDSLTGLVFFLLIGKWYQNKTYQSLSFERDYKSYFPVAVTKLENGNEESIPIKKLKKGDIILIRNQELIPADARLLKGSGQIDYSFVTGESRPIMKKAGEEVFAGGKQMGNSIEIQIEKEIEQSKLTQIWNQKANSEDKGRKLVSVIDSVSKYFTIIIILVALGTGIFWFFTDVSVVLNAFTSVLIVACPCALALSIPFAFGNMMRLLGRKGFYLKEAQVIESLSKVDTIVFDKTGTITYGSGKHISFVGTPLNSEEKMFVKSLSRHSTHPLSMSLSQFLLDQQQLEVTDYREIKGRGIIGKIKSIEIRLGSAEFVGEETSKVVGASQVYVAIDKKIRGYFTIKNQYRSGLNELIDSLHKNFELHLISGDNESEKENLSEFFKEDKNLHFNQSPQEKLEYIKKLQNNGKKVLMIGDGLNDAGALAESYTGISVADDVFQFSPACDAILDAENFKNIGQFIKLSRKSLWVVYFSFAISFLYNIIGLSFAIQGLLSPIIAAILMPISSVTVVGFVTISTSVIYKNILKH